MEMTVRFTALDDVSSVLQIYSQVSEFLKANGVDEWQDGYPGIEILTQDIESRSSFVVLLDDAVVATYAIESADSAYDRITEGSWSFTGPYFVIHCLAICAAHRGARLSNAIFGHIRAYAVEHEVQGLRVDTHMDNALMQHELRNWGFKFCGIVWQNGAERLAFDLLVKV